MNTKTLRTITAQARADFQAQLRVEEALLRQQEQNDKQHSGTISSNSRRSRLIILRGDIGDWLREDPSRASLPITECDAVKAAIAKGLISAEADIKKNQVVIPETINRNKGLDITAQHIKELNGKFRNLRLRTAQEWRAEVEPFFPEFLAVRLAKFVWWDFAASAPLADGTGISYDIELKDLVDRDLTDEEMAEVSGEELAIALWMVGYPAHLANRRAGQARPVVVIAQSPLQSALLDTLRVSGPLNTNACARSINKPTAAANSALNSLRGRGLVTMAPSEAGLMWTAV